MRGNMPFIHHVTGKRPAASNGNKKKLWAYLLLIWIKLVKKTCGSFVNG